MDITVCYPENSASFRRNWAELELAEWFIDSNPCPLYPLFSLLRHAHAQIHRYTHTARRESESQSVYVRINSPCFIIFAPKSFSLDTASPCIAKKYISIFLERLTPIQRCNAPVSYNSDLIARNSYICLRV